MDLPVWQAFSEELRDRGLTVVTVAMDAGGAADAAFWIENARPTHPSLVDERHVVAERYGWVNVPSIAWIDEAGRLVRPNDPGWAGDYFRGMMKPGFEMDAMRAESERLRGIYLDTVRDWVANGPASRWALPPDEVRRRLAPRDPDRAHAAAWFRLGVLLHERGRRDAAQAAFAKARALNPDSWNYTRQSLHLKEPGASGGPEFWAAVEALGEKRYYPNQEL
jgi:tetratricopeptide (TPR) repeat protein